MTALVKSFLDPESRRVLAVSCLGLAMTLSHLETIIRIGIGLATFSYLALKNYRAWRNRHRDEED